MFGPLRTLGVPEPLIDVVEPFFRVIVELGYDRSIPPGEPTPARLIPPLNPVNGGRRSRQRDRRGHQQRRGPHRLATAAEHSRSADRNHNSRRLRPDGNGSRSPNRRDDNRQQVTGTDETTTGQQVTGTDETTPGQQVTGTDETTRGSRSPNRRDDTGAAGHRTDETTPGQQVTQTDQTATPTVSTSKPWKRAGRHEMSRHVVRGPLGVYGQQTPRTAALRRYRRAHRPDTGCRRCGHDRGTSSPESSSGDGSPGARSPHREHRQGAQPGHPAQNAQP